MHRWIHQYKSGNKKHRTKYRGREVRQAVVTNDWMYSDSARKTNQP